MEIRFFRWNRVPRDKVRVGKFVPAFMNISFDRGSGSGNKSVFEKSRVRESDNQ